VAVGQPQDIGSSRAKTRTDTGQFQQQCADGPDRVVSEALDSDDSEFGFDDGGDFGRGRRASCNCW